MKRTMRGSWVSLLMLLAGCSNGDGSAGASSSSVAGQGSSTASGAVSGKKQKIRANLSALAGNEITGVVEYNDGGNGSFLVEVDFFSCEPNQDYAVRLWGSMDCANIATTNPWQYAIDFDVTCDADGNLLEGQRLRAAAEGLSWSVGDGASQDLLGRAVIIGRGTTASASTPVACGTFMKVDP
jgi:hypothetical protein